jgi:hypothetical protein
MADILTPSCDNLSPPQLVRNLCLAAAVSADWYSPQISLQPNLRWQQSPLKNKNPSKVYNYVHLEIINRICDYGVSIPHRKERKVNGAELSLRSRGLLISSRKSLIHMQSEWSSPRSKEPQLQPTVRKCLSSPSKADVFPLSTKWHMYIIFNKINLFRKDLYVITNWTIDSTFKCVSATEDLCFGTKFKLNKIDNICLT